MTLVCANPRCERESYAWEIDHDSGWCATCIYERRHAALTAATQVDEDSPEFEVACRELERLEDGGARDVEDELERRYLKRQRQVVLGVA